MKEGIAGIIKFVLAILLVPVVIAATGSFFNQVLSWSGPQHAFLWGIVAYVLCYFFVVKFEKFFSFGQRIFGDLLGFTGTASHVIARLIPLYPVLVLAVLYILRVPLRVGWVDGYFVFAAGFTLAMHLALSAQEIREEDGSVVKPHYVFEILFVYLCCLLITAALLNANFAEFSLKQFCVGTFHQTRDMYASLYHLVRR